MIHITTHDNSSNTSIDYEPILKLQPSDRDLAECAHICYAYTTLIAMGLATSYEMWSRGHCSVQLSVNWSVIKFGKYTIPAPLSVDTDKLGLLVTSPDHSVAMSDEERAYANAVHYLETLRLTAANWRASERSLNPSMAKSIRPAVRWFKKLPQDDYRSIVNAATSKLSDKVLNTLN